jgi:predicted permease
MVAWGLGTIFRLKNSQRSFAMCAAMFQNSNSLPIALIQVSLFDSESSMNADYGVDSLFFSVPAFVTQSLVVEVPGFRWGNQDTKDQMLGRALAYLVVYSTLGMMVSHLKARLGNFSLILLKISFIVTLVLRSQAPVESR